MDKVCIFDVNETLLDMAALDPLFAQHLGDAGERPLWFRTVLQTSLALTLTDSYQPFATIVEETLRSRAAARGIELGPQARQAFKDAIRALPLHADVLPALKALKAGGYRVAALTNSSADTARAQLSRAGVETLFEAILSTDAVKAAKPAPQPYLHAAQHLAVAPSALWLVAAHAWDTHGAKSAGLKTALVRRPAHGLNGCFATPDVHGDDMPKTLDAVMAHDRPLVSRMLHPGVGT